MSQEYTVIHEVYDSEDAELFFEDQLERSLEAQIPYIIIEPIKIGNETAKWIQLGNFIHKTAVLAGLGCLITPLILPKKFGETVSVTLGGLTLSCTGLYGLSWQFDPCCKYQVEYDVKDLEKLNLEGLTTASPVVLVRKDDTYRKRLHNFAAICVTVYFAWKAYKWYLSS